MAAAFDSWVIRTPPRTVRMNVNQTHMPHRLADQLDRPPVQETNVATFQDMISITLLPGAVVEFFAEGMHVASFQVTEDGKDVYATEGLDEKELRQ